MNVLVVCKDLRERKAEKIITNEGLNIKYSWKNNLTKKEFDKIDLVIAVGGDGTVLSASHYLIDKPLLAVNSNPKESVGALTTISLNELREKLEKIKKGNFKTEKLERIQLNINGKSQDFLALNDIFLANEKAYLISKYKLRIKNIEEEQLSSGLIFSTGTGSTAWFKSAGGNPFSPHEKFIKLIVREPYQHKHKPFKTIEHSIQENESISIETLTPSILAIDSIREYILNKNDKIEIKISSHPLIRIV